MAGICFSSDHSNRDPQEDLSPPQSRRRRTRYDFGSIPSFREFQHNFEVRRLYRNFMRLLKTQHGEMRDLVRREFRVPASADAVNRRVTEGRRRLKEIQAMVNAQSGGKLDPTTAASSATSGSHHQLHSSSQIWPWNRKGDSIQLPTNENK
jgi:hypothetical protein